MNCILMVIIGCSRKCYCNMSHYLIPIQHSPGFSQKTFEYYIFCVFFNSYSKSFNQNTAFIGYDVLIDLFWSTSTKLIFENVLWWKSRICLLIGVMLNKDAGNHFFLQNICLTQTGFEPPTSTL